MQTESWASRGVDESGPSEQEVVGVIRKRVCRSPRRVNAFIDQSCTLPLRIATPLCHKTTSATRNTKMSDGVRYCIFRFWGGLGLLPGMVRVRGVKKKDPGQLGCLRTVIVPCIPTS